MLSYFVDVMKGERVIKSYDHFHPLFNRARPLMGCLDFLVTEGFFTGDELNDALTLICDGSSARSRCVVRIAEIVMRLKE